MNSRALINGNSLDALANEPALAYELTPFEAEKACGRALMVIAAVAARMLKTEPPEPPPPPPLPLPPPEDERMMNVREAATMTGLSRDYLYRHKELPFRVQVTRKRIGFSYRETLNWINSNRGRMRL